MAPEGGLPGRTVVESKKERKKGRQGQRTCHRKKGRQGGVEARGSQVARAFGVDVSGLFADGCGVMGWMWRDGVDVA